LRIDRLREGVHAIETFRCRAGRQPLKIAVGTRDIAVRACRDVDDDFSMLRHEYPIPLAKGPSSDCTGTAITIPSAFERGALAPRRARREPARLAGSRRLDREAPQPSSP